MSLEPLARKADWVALTSVMCGLAPPVLALMSILPFVGCLTSPLMLAAVPCAIGFGVAGVVRARAHPEPNYVLPLTGVVLGLAWVLLATLALVFFSRSGALNELYKHLS